MDTEKDYYSILGVLPSIDDLALAAVYRALLKKYHPDVFSGSKAEAERRTREIVEAYEVLGNTINRRAYDSARKHNGFGNYEEEDRPNSVDVTSDWEVVKKYHPETVPYRPQADSAMLNTVLRVVSSSGPWPVAGFVSVDPTPQQNADNSAPP